MKEIIRKVLREEYDEKKIKSILFKFWDKYGPSLEFGKFLSLSDSDTAKYLYEYHGENVTELVTDSVKFHIENYHSCDGDEFNLRFDNIFFNYRKGVPYYNVNFSIDYNSNVLQDNDFKTTEEIMVLFGQIEGCVENMLNDTVNLKYGIYVLNGMVNGVY
jgi:hypothetical protein